MDSTSASLLARACSGNDDQTWQRLHDIYAPLIRNWLTRQNVAPDEADDLAQDVLIVVFRKLPSFEHNGRPGAFRRWLRLIVVNCLRDSYNKKKRRGSRELSEFLDQFEDPSSSVSQQWDANHDLEVTRQLLEQIRPTFADHIWQAFQLLTRDELPVDQVAERLGLSVANVYQAKSRVLARLREKAAGLIDE